MENFASGNLKTKRRETNGDRIIRDSAVSRKIKKLYRDTCRICGETVQAAIGSYAEGAHIKPLGPPHDGPDIEENIVCLCPSHHAMLEYGGLTVNDDLSLLNSFFLNVARSEWRHFTE